MDNEFMRTPKKKKGLLQMLFSRVGLMIILILIQLGIITVVYYYFADNTKWFAIVQGIFSFVMVLYLFNCDMDSSAKLTWLALIMLFPIPATIMLWYSNRSIGHRNFQKKFGELILVSRDKVTQDESVIAKDELIESGTANLCNYLSKSGAFPIYEHTKVEYFPSGEAKFAKLVEELKKAEHFIFMEYFIIYTGYMWATILDILAEKVKQGVDVRVMYDGTCEMSVLPHDFPERVAEYGIKCKSFSPIAPFVSTQYNYRDHRKILVIDGKVAFNGGINIADEYINRVERCGHWKDTAVMLTGEAVKSFTLMFLQMWNTDEENPQWDECAITHKAENDGYVMPYGDTPLDEYRVGEMVYMDILNTAKKYVHIMTPYLILDDELLTALKYAAGRGIDVKLILPGVPDQIVTNALAKSHYKSLIESGVKVYEYVPGFVHAKVFVSDDEKAVVGTINLDYRSLYHHFECATYLYKTSCIQDICKDFEETLAKCSEVTYDTIRNEKISSKLLGLLAKWFAPML